MMAHDFFCEDDDGDGVKFFVVKATGKLQFPDVKWSIDEFMVRISEHLQLDLVLDELKSAVIRMEIIKGIASGDDASSLPTVMNRLLHPSQSNADYSHPQASPETPSQPPEEKE